MRSSVLSALSSAGCMMPALLNCMQWVIGARACEQGKDAHHDVEAAEELDSLVDRSLDVRLLAHIGFERGGLDVGETLLDERERLLGCGEVNVDEEDVRALEEQDAAEAGGGSVTALRASSLVRLRRPVEGTSVPLDQVPDPTFSQGIMGPGIAIEPSDGLVLAPAEGTVAHVFPTGHAVALTLEDGVEVLIHVGLDTVEMKGEGFETLVEVGQHVVAGTPLLRADLAAIRIAGHEAITPVIVMNDRTARIELV